MLFHHSNGLLLMRTDRLEERTWRSDPCYKFIFSPWGANRFQMKKEEVHMSPQTFLVVNPLEEHKQLHITKEKFLVELSPLFLQETANTLGYKSLYDLEFALYPYQHPQIKQWALFVRDYLQLQIGKEQNDTHLFLEHSISQLAILLIKLGLGSHQTSFPINSSHDLIQGLTKILQESYQEDWSLDRMASTIHLNKYQLAHLFKETTGVSPYSWLQIYRLFRSQARLLHTKASITTIALEVGFRNVATYNHLFKKVYGKTPTQFRLLHSQIEK